MEDRAEMFDGITAVADAGGRDGFIREVTAEARTTALEAVRSGDLRPPHTLLVDTVYDVIERRLQPDLERLCLEAAERVRARLGSRIQSVGKKALDEEIDVELRSAMNRYADAVDTLSRMTLAV